MPRHLVVDAGPIIGLIDVLDAYHDAAARGIRQLHAARTQLLLPTPILFEVYKRISYDVNNETARRALTYMRDAFELEFVGRDELAELEVLVESMPWWGGSLEDGVVAMIGLSREIPVWTFNYRDLGAFQNLTFWTPG